MTGPCCWWLVVERYMSILAWPLIIPKKEKSKLQYTTTLKECWTIHLPFGKMESAWQLQPQTVYTKHVKWMTQNWNCYQTMKNMITIQLQHRTYIYISKRGCPDLQTSFAFNFTRVHNPDRDDQRKLSRTFWYLNNTRHLPLIFSTNETGIIKWWVDASFDVHDGMKSRTGMNMSMGKGTLYAVSIKKKLNTGSST